MQVKVLFLVYKYRKNNLLRNFILKLALIPALGAAFSLSGQNSPSGANSECLTTRPPNYSNWRTSTAQIQNMVPTLKHDTCLNKKFSIVFYVVADSLGTWGSLTQTNL